MLSDAMDQAFDPLNLLILAIAVVIFFTLALGSGHAGPAMSARLSIPSRQSGAMAQRGSPTKRPAM